MNPKEQHIASVNIPKKRNKRWLLLIAAITILSLAFLNRSQAQSTPLVLRSIADLRAVNTTGFTNDQVAYVMDYYFPEPTDDVQGRGGGHFRWHTTDFESAHDDGGRWIGNTNNSNNTNGIWERLLEGQTPNVKMWGAVGDGVANDYVAITNAIFACGGWNCGELLFPRTSSGNKCYLITNTLVFDAGLHIRGEGTVTCIMMSTNAQKDILQTGNAYYALNGSYNPNGYDDGLLVENIKLQFQTINDSNNNVIWHNSSNSCLVVCQPGEVFTIRNISTENGGFGIRCLGPGAPGLRVHDVQVDNAAIAGISVEPVPGATSVGGDGHSLNGVSGDMRYFDSYANASLIRFVNCGTGAEIANIKSEGDFGGGVVQYAANPGQYGIEIDSILNIHDCSYNFGLSESTNIPTFVKLLPGTSSRTVVVSLQSIGGANFANLIEDDLAGRVVPVADPAVYANASLPMIYDSFNAGIYGMRSKLVIGQTAYVTFYPTNVGWYRVMHPLAGGYTPAHLGGRLSWFVPILDNTELEVDAGGNTSANPVIDVLRAKPSGSTSPVITQARAFQYWDNVIGGYWAYVDLYVSNTNSYGHPVTVTLDLNGAIVPVTGECQLMGPILYEGTGAVETTVPVTGTISQIVTNNTYR